MVLKLRRKSALVSVSIWTGLFAMLVQLGLALPPAQAQTNPQRPAPAPTAPAPPAGAVGGMGDVNVFPKRVVINQKQRVATVGLYNRAAAQSDYDITLTDMIMTPDGRITELASVTDPVARSAARPASALLRWSPRRVTLASFESQTIRIMARIPPDLPPGEYRTHFSVLAVPQSAVGGYTIEQATGASIVGGIGVTIVPRFGISIPVILRVGETTLTAGLRDLTIAVRPDGTRAIELTITRDGTRSAFGDLTVTATGSKAKITEIKGIGVYTEVNQRTVQIPLDPASNPLTARGARLTVTYTDDDFAPGKILARQDFIVP